MRDLLRCFEAGCSQSGMQLPEKEQAKKTPAQGWRKRGCVFAYSEPDTVQPSNQALDAEGSTAPA